MVMLDLRVELALQERSKLCSFKPCCRLMALFMVVGCGNGWLAQFHDLDGVMNIKSNNIIWLVESAIQVLIEGKVFSDSFQSRSLFVFSAHSF